MHAISSWFSLAGFICIIETCYLIIATRPANDPQETCGLCTLTCKRYCKAECLKLFHYPINHTQGQDEIQAYFMLELSSSKVNTKLQQMLQHGSRFLLIVYSLHNFFSGQTQGLHNLPLVAGFTCLCSNFTFNLINSTTHENKNLHSYSQACNNTFFHDTIHIPIQLSRYDTRYDTLHNNKTRRVQTEFIKACPYFYRTQT